MNDTLSIAIIPLDIAWADVSENLDRVKRYMSAMHDQGIKPDIAVLPELFSTGFITDAALLKECCEPIDGPTLDCIRNLSAEYGWAIAGGYAASDCGKFYNRAFFIKPDGSQVFYDKRHLFSLSAEATVFSPGEGLPPVVDFKGWNISMIVCYDMRFPVWCRSVRYTYDVMLVPANWPEARAYAWNTLLSARAIENQSVYVGCDRSGCDDYGRYDGLSKIVDAYGVPVGGSCDLGNGMEIIIAEVSRKHLEQCRRRLPTGNDMDDFSVACSAVIS